jgi:ketosteroid isomerase-like protein
MKEKVFVLEKNMNTAKAFSEINFWEKGNEELFTEDFCLDLPYAPPGMYQHLGKNEVEWHYDWLRNTVSDWKWTDIKVLGTNQEGIFWIFRIGEGNVCWGGIHGTYRSKFATLLKIDEGKISYAKDHFDMVEFYRAIGVELPTFYYDAKSPEDFPQRIPAPKVDHTEESLQAQIRKTLDFFESPNYWDPKVNEVLADNFVHELTFAPKDMPRIFKGTEYDALNEWLDRHLVDGNIYDEVFYETTDPHIFITEYNCIFTTNWGYQEEDIQKGAHGRYPNREISYIEVDDDGRCVRLDEYLNTMSKFLSTNVRIPTFPYLYY